MLRLIQPAAVFDCIFEHFTESHGDGFARLRRDAGQERGEQLLRSGNRVQLTRNAQFDPVGSGRDHLDLARRESVPASFVSVVGPPPEGVVDETSDDADTCKDVEEGENLAHFRVWRYIPV